mmetsp:Transcript_7898/g.20905  ORF Transcript_7898/g.20905 Transcript_7898/m.20905 type:complete len:224 (+) Transcript_7898:263-934(+)
MSRKRDSGELGNEGRERQRMLPSFEQLNRELGLSAGQLSPQRRDSGPSNFSHPRHGITPFKNPSSQSAIALETAITASDAVALEPPQELSSDARLDKGSEVDEELKVATQVNSTGPPLGGSKYCHVCARKGARIELVWCKTSLLGPGKPKCKKAFCRKCLEDYAAAMAFQFDVDKDKVRYADYAAARNDPKWICLHCRNMCPANARCVRYSVRSATNHALHVS